MIPVLLKNMITILLVWGLGFVVGSYCAYKGLNEELEKVGVRLEDYL